MKKFKALISVILTLTMVMTFFASSVYAAKKNFAPSVSNVKITGTTEVGQTLTGTYTYFDKDGDAEGGSLYKWQRADSATGIYSSISGATTKAYTLTDADAGKYIKFYVTPVSKTGSPNVGAIVSSSAVGPVAKPIVQTEPTTTPDTTTVTNTEPASTTTTTTTDPATSTTTTDSSTTTTSPTTTDTSTTTPTTQEPAPAPQPTKVVLGFATKYYSTDVSSYNSMVNNTKSLNQIATVTYSADSFGNVLGTAPKDQIDYASANGLTPLALINNSDSSGFNASIAQSIMSNSIYKQAFINNIVNVVKANGYKGVNIDFEGISYTYRSSYTQLISDIHSALAPLGYITSISVPAKTADSPTNSWNGAFDYAALGTAADEILIMSYDEHGSWGSPGPVASLGWVTNVVNFAKTVIPTNKILLGVAAYGYEWSSAGNKAYSLNKIYSIISTFGGSAQWDAASQTPYYTYVENGITKTIWFENAQSVAYKLDLVNQNNLRGIGIWRLGLENSDYWNTINTKFSK